MSEPCSPLSETDLQRDSIKAFDEFRENYDNISFDDLVKSRNEILHKFPEQASYTADLVELWIAEHVQSPVRIIEIGGWRGDLADEMLAKFPSIECWDNFDLISDVSTQKCAHEKYQIISLSDYIWNLEIDEKYNALVATHMIEHIKWRQLKAMIEWIPDHIHSVLFEAPVAGSAEDFDWAGDFSSHILEKGWQQIVDEMAKNRFASVLKEKDTVIFER